MATLSDAGIALIKSVEGCSTKPDWPGGMSGVTIGYGYDLGYCNIDQFASDWGQVLIADPFSALRPAVGLTGQRAKNFQVKVAKVAIARADADVVLVESSLPLTEAQLRVKFPGADALCDNAFSALVSLVYNRGTSTSDPPGSDRRREMRDIRDALANATLDRVQKLTAIAAALRSMKRLWAGQGLDGLIKRRELEAKLVETCL
jgi:GH24 family phage-related lysozyme (muramidase)